MGGDILDVFTPKKSTKPKKVEVPEPPPPPTITEAEREVDLRAARRRKRRGAAASVLTGDRGLEGALGPVSTTTAGAKALMGPGPA